MLKEGQESLKASEVAGNSPLQREAKARAFPRSKQSVAALCLAWGTAVKQCELGNMTFSCSRPFKQKQNFKDHLPEPQARSHTHFPAPAPQSLWHRPRCQSSSQAWIAERWSLHLLGRCQSHPRSCWTRPPRWGVAGRWLPSSAAGQPPLCCSCSFEEMDMSVRHLQAGPLTITVDGCVPSQSPREA